MHQPGLAIWGLTWCTVIILINGFEVFWNFTASRFLTGCVYQPLNHHFPPNVIYIPTLGYADINIPIFFGLYAFWKVTKKTKVWRPEEMDFVTVSCSPSTCSRPLLRYWIFQRPPHYNHFSYPALGNSYPGANRRTRNLPNHFLAEGHGHLVLNVLHALGDNTPLRERV